MSTTSARAGRGWGALALVELLAVTGIIGVFVALTLEGILDTRDKPLICAQTHADSFLPSYRDQGRIAVSDSAEILGLGLFDVPMPALINRTSPTRMPQGRSENECR
jgi:hypothetical protein